MVVNLKDDIFYWVWLSSLQGVGSIKGRLLLDAFGSPKGIWQANRKQLSSVKGMTDNFITKILDITLRNEVDRHLENIEKWGIEVISIDEPQYPKLLSNIYNPPLTIFVRGHLRSGKCVAIVGSRKATDYGLNTAKNLARDLAAIGVNVVSGMARGIDSKAHEGALEAGGATTAVLGCGPDIVYPPENKLLMKKIIYSGAVVSEYLPGFPPLATNFPARNRIVSGLCCGVVVIEANERSGSLITANFALEQGREVFAVPGNVTSYNSVGSNQLIKDGAKMVTGILDIIEEIRHFSIEGQIERLKGINDINDIEMKTNSFIKGLQGIEKNIGEALIENNLHIDVLSQKTGIKMKDLNALLIVMELSGKVEQLPGKIFRIPYM